MVITVEVEMPSVGHDSWQKAERVLIFSVGWVRRSSRCLWNEARKLPVTVFGNPVQIPWGFVVGV